MNIVQFLASFFYRIRYWLLWGSLLVTALVIYFTQFLPYSYTVNSSLYAGVTNSTNLDGSQLININSTFDNIINIGKSKNTLAKVSVRLLATSLVYGDEWKDNMYIQAKHYRQLVQILPKEVLALVDRSSLDKTTNNLMNYRKENSSNFVYSIFNRPYPYYSYSALSTITIKRLGTSDLIELVYTSSDPGITQNTLKILEDELLKAYEQLRFSATNSAIAYFEEQVRIAKKALTAEEDDLTDYSVQKQVINYDEQSKALALTKYATDDRMEEVQRNYGSAVALRQMLENKMDIRAKIIRTNTNLLQELEKVSTLNQSILEQEIFTTEQSQQNSDKLQREKDALQKAEEKIRNINEAYKILSDGFLREQYDKELQKEEDIYNQRVYKQKEKNTNYKADTKKKNRKEDYAQEQMPTHNVGTFMSLVDLVSVTFKNMPKREKRKLQKEDFIAGGLTILIVGILIVVLWFIPATNGFVKSLLPFLN